MGWVLPCASLHDATFHDAVKIRSLRKTVQQCIYCAPAAATEYLRDMESVKPYVVSMYRNSSTALIEHLDSFCPASGFTRLPDLAHVLY